jgi:hypothetical protein
MLAEEQPQVTECCPVDLVAGAEGGKRVLLKDTAEAVGDCHVVGWSTPPRARWGKTVSNSQVM